jgi:transcriptional regulator with XRE-family HTH domain
MQTTQTLAQLLSGARQQLSLPGAKKTWRKRIGLRQLAKRCGVSFSTIKGWEDGRSPYAIYLPIIAKAYQISLARVQAAYWHSREAR